MRIAAALLVVVGLAAHGELGSMPVTSAPVCPGSASCSAVSLLTGSTVAPSQLRDTWPTSRSAPTTSRTRSIGIANDSSPGRSPVATATPITWPAVSSTGPPELPRWMRASVWMKVRKPIWRPAASEPAPSRPVADTMPVDAVTSSPNGLPSTTTHSPTWMSLESPSGSGDRSLRVR
jgi:hypothetical protein